jgi:N-acetylglutamate synthase-like GNAT family acetyltransferase
MAEGLASPIRAARQGHLPRLLALLHQRAQQGQMPDEPLAEPAERQRETLQTLVDDPNAALRVLEADGLVQGTCALYVLPNLSHGTQSFDRAENVVVDEAARGLRYGELLMAEAGRRASDASLLQGRPVQQPSPS